jgi:hypothetical protein
MNKSRKNTKKRLHKGKKIEAKKPLFVAAEHGATTGGSGKVTFNPFSITIKTDNITPII